MNLIWKNLKNLKMQNATRRITNMLMFNGDIEGRFNPV